MKHHFSFLRLFLFAFGTGGGGRAQRVRRTSEARAETLAPINDTRHRGFRRPPRLPISEVRTPTRAEARGSPLGRPLTRLEVGPARWGLRELRDPGPDPGSRTRPSRNGSLVSRPAPPTAPTPPTCPRTEWEDGSGGRLRSDSLTTETETSTPLVPRRFLQHLSVEDPRPGPRERSLGVPHETSSDL